MLTFNTSTASDKWSVRPSNAKRLNEALQIRSRPWNVQPAPSTQDVPEERSTVIFKNPTLCKADVYWVDATSKEKDEIYKHSVDPGGEFEHSGKLWDRLHVRFPWSKPKEPLYTAMFTPVQGKVIEFDKMQYLTKMRNTGTATARVHVDRPGADSETFELCPGCDKKLILDVCVPMTFELPDKDYDWMVQPTTGSKTPDAGPIEISTCRSDQAGLECSGTEVFEFVMAGLAGSGATNIEL